MAMRAFQRGVSGARLRQGELFNWNRANNINSWPTWKVNNQVPMLNARSRRLPADLDGSHIMSSNGALAILGIVLGSPLFMG